MKKFILPLLVLLFVGSLFAVESDPSDVVGYVKYDCVAGNNLIALPLDSGYTYSSEFADANPGNIDAISEWDPINQGWITASDLGGFWDLDLEITPESVFMINATGPFSLYSLGNLPSINPSFDLVVGNNTVFVPLNRSDIALSDDLGMDLAVVDAISYWDAVNQGWVTASDLGGFWDFSFDVAIGYPVMVNAFSNGTWGDITRSNSQSQTIKRSNQ